MSKRSVSGDRPPSYMSKATLAAELDISETTVDSWVERGVIPPPIRCGVSPRWCWAQVDASLRVSNMAEADPFMAGARNAS